MSDTGFFRRAAGARLRTNRSVERIAGDFHRGQSPQRNGDGTVTELCRAAADSAAAAFYDFWRRTIFQASGSAAAAR